MTEVGAHEARLMALCELFALPDLNLHEMRQGFESLRDVAREALLEIGGSGLRERVALYADALVETTVILEGIAAEERDEA